MNKREKIIIIGNGFDLCAKLQSSFNDFFINSEIKKVANFCNGPNAGYDVSKISFFSLLLYNTFYRPDINTYIQNISFQSEFRQAFNIENNAVDWMDVESFIYSFLTSNNIDKVRDSFNGLITNKKSSGVCCICMEDGINDLIAKKALDAKMKKDFYEFLFDELNLFEKRFSEYLGNNVESNEQYKNFAKVIIDYLAGYDNGTIINFNYTDIQSICPLDVVNVHGLLGEIIIGIDDKIENDNKKMSNDKIIRFTKTFRKLEREDRRIVLHSDVDEIVIYGHSLGQQDYSYFQSIFDYVKLYDGKTIVKFIYSDYFVNEEQKMDHKIKMTKKLFNLIRNYGATLDNKNNGHNLIHKMILEGRLIIAKNNFFH